MRPKLVLALRRADPAPNLSVVQFVPMTTTEAQAWADQLADKLPNKMEMAGHSWSRRWDAYRFIIPATLSALGLVRDETVAEKFARETGYEATPAVLAALEWVRDK